MRIYFTRLFLLLIFLKVAIVWSQPAAQKNTSPIEAVKRVANKMVRTTPFTYKLVQNKPSTSFDNTKFINLARTFGSGKPGVAYLLSVINSPVDTTAAFQISHSDGIKIWVNKSIVYEKNKTQKAVVTYKERAMDLESEFSVPLKKGKNEIFLKSETAGNEWVLYLRPKRNLKDLKLSIEYLPLADTELSKLTNWLVIGPFPNPIVNNGRTGLNKVYEPENGFETGKLYQYDSTSIAWTIPKVEVGVDGMGSQGAWPGDHNFAWNYHAGGVAWAMCHLGDYTGQQSYASYARKYCDFYIDKKPFLKFWKYNLGAMGSGDAKIAETYMLDFTAAPALPLTYQLEHNKTLINKKEYEDFYNEIKEYVVNKQTRLPEGNFTRNMPHKYTTWADDMYMGIPFIVHASLLAKDEAEKKHLMDDAVNQIFAFNNQVWDTEFNLYRQSQYSDRKVKIPFWSRANGWGIWAVSEVLQYLPKNHPKYKALLSHYKAHVDGLLKYQDAQTGFWHNLIDKPDSYPETSGTAIFAMAMARGINNGWIERKKYEPYTLKAWKAVESMIETDGTLHGTCIGTNMSENIQDYYTRPVADDDTHGILPVLFAGIEVDKMMQNRAN